MRARAVPMPRIYHRRPYNRPMTVARHCQTFPARRDALPRVDAFLGEVCSGAGLGRDTCLRLTLLVEGLFTNPVEPGPRGAAEDAGCAEGDGWYSEAPVCIECEVSPGRVALTYEDTGPAHDPFARVIPPDAGAGVEERPVGGLGVLLVSEMAKKVNYQRAGARNRISLVIPARS